MAENSSRLMLAGATQQQRIELQQHIDRFEGRIRRRLRGKLAALARRVYDEDDVMASMRQRVRDVLIQQLPGMEARSLWLSVVQA